MRFTDKIAALYMAKEQSQMEQKILEVKTEKDRVEKELNETIAKRLKLSLNRETALKSGASGAGTLSLLHFPHVMGYKASQLVFPVPTSS